MRELIKKLTSIYGPAGNEELISQAIREEIEPYVDEIEVDVMGCLLADLLGNGLG